MRRWPGMFAPFILMQERFQRRCMVYAVERTFRACPELAEGSASQAAPRSSGNSGIAVASQIKGMRNVPRGTFLIPAFHRRRLAPKMKPAEPIAH
jgi:hypothetical protein